MPNRQARRAREKDSRAREKNKSRADAVAHRHAKVLHSELQTASNWSRIVGVLKHHNNSEVDAKSHQKIMTVPYYSHHLLTAGKASNNDMAVLFQSFLFALALLDRMIEFSNLKDELEALRDDLHRAELALLQINRRSFDLEGRFVAKGDELRALSRCLGILDGLVEASTLNHLSASLQRSIDKLNERRTAFEQGTYHEQINPTAYTH